MATNWGGILKPARGPGYGLLARSRTLDGGDTELGHATWKEEELQQQYQENDPQYLQAMAQKQYQEDQIRLKQEQMDQVKREKEKAAYEQWQKEQILNSVADSRYQDKLLTGEMGSAQTLAEQAKRAAAEATRRGQGNFATDFLDIAAKYEDKAKNYQITQQNLQDKKLNDVRETLSTVNDPVSWAMAKPELAKAGVEVPPQFQSWSPDTAKWVDTQSRLSSSVQAANRLQDYDQSIKDKKAIADAKLEAQKERDRQKTTDEALKRELIVSNKPLSGQALEGTIGEFKGKGEFDNLEPNDQIAAARELPLVQKYLLETKAASSAIEAKNMAKEDIMARIKDGKFSPFAPEDNKAPSTQGVAKPSSQEEFDALPKGATFINPADGKTYIKK